MVDQVLKTGRDSLQRWSECGNQSLRISESVICGKEKRFKTGYNKTADKNAYHKRKGRHVSDGLFHGLRTHCLP